LSTESYDLCERTDNLSLNRRSAGRPETGVLTAEAIAGRASPRPVTRFHPNFGPLLVKRDFVRVISRGLGEEGLASESEKTDSFSRGYLLESLG
jgi:hypothetical protein